MEAALEGPALRLSAELLGSQQSREPATLEEVGSCSLQQLSTVNSTRLFIYAPVYSKKNLEHTIPF